MSNLYRITSAGLKPLVVKDYALGRAVRYTGDMANPSGIGAIVAIRAATQYGPKSYDIALTDGRRINGTFLDGSRWQVAEDHVSPDALEILRAGVIAKEASDKAKASADALAFSQAVERIKAENPHLIQGAGCVIAAKNMRIELKRTFPSVKFSVKTEKYSGGNSVNVSWVDGPNSKQVEKIIKKYSGGDFDGMTDCYNYKSSPWTEVFGEAKYIFAHRSYSDQLVAKIARLVRSKLGGIEASEAELAEAYKKGDLWKIKQSGGCDVSRCFNEELSKRTLALSS